MSVAIDTVPLPTRPSHAAAMRPGPPGPGSVPRARLVRRLVGATDARVVLLVAPAGYGKTTLIAEWAARDERPFVCVDAESAFDATGVVVVDDAHLADPAVLRALIESAGRRAHPATLVLASRELPPGPLGRLRAHRRLVELRADELAMTRLEAAMLVDAAGLRIDAAGLDRLLAKTGGWPAALYLAARVVAEADDPNAALARFGGGDRALAGFLRDDVLDGLTEAQLVFLRRTAVLEQLDAAACDAVLDAHGSGAVLDDLRAHGVPMDALDPCELSFVYHPLLAEAMRAERARLEPEHEPELHRRAARHHARRPDEALPHAIACGDLRLAGRMLWTLTPAAAAENRMDRITCWLGHFDDRDFVREPTLALTAAVDHLLAGRRDAAERAISHLPDGHAEVELVRACLGCGDMGAHAARAQAALPPWSPWQALASLLSGVAAHLAGDTAAAMTALEDAVGRAGELGVIASLAHAQLALVAADRDAWDDATRHSAAARAALGPSGPDAVAALVLATGAVAAAQRGDIAEARHDAADAQRRLAAQPDLALWLTAETELWLARASIQLSDGPAARRLLARAAHLQPRIDGDRTLARWIHDGWARADAFAETATGDGPMLTNAELRVLRLLPSHMSFREIGARLHVSTNTVKTQALAVYRKLDVSCRSDAVARGRSAGLIGGA